MPILVGKSALETAARERPVPSGPPADAKALLRRSAARPDPLTDPVTRLRLRLAVEKPASLPLRLVPNPREAKDLRDELKPENERGMPAERNIGDPDPRANPLPEKARLPENPRAPPPLKARAPLPPLNARAPPPPPLNPRAPPPPPTCAPPPPSAKAATRLSNRDRDGDRKERNHGDRRNSSGRKNRNFAMLVHSPLLRRVNAGKPGGGRDWLLATTFLNPGPRPKGSTKRAPTFPKPNIVWADYRP